MDISSCWDGTLSQTDFYNAARTLSEKWRITNSTFPPWKWVPCTRPFGVIAHKVEGHLSLENLCYLRCNELQEEYGDGKEANSYNVKEESTDDATLVHRDDEEVHYYDYHILYSTSYRVPVLYFRGYHCDGQPLALEDIEKDLPSNSLNKLRDSKWTFMTQEEHPYLNRPWFTLHPCGTSEWMKLLLLGDVSLTKHGEVFQQYLVSWLSVVGQAVGLRVPLEMLNKSSLCTASSNSC